MRAKAPDVLDVNYVDYLTPGKTYEVFLDDGNWFNIKDDEDELLICLWDGCFHLSGDSSKSWTRIYDEDE